MKQEDLEHQLNKYFNDHESHDLDENVLWKSMKDRLDAEKEESKPIPFLYYILGGSFLIFILIAVVWSNYYLASQSDRIPSGELMAQKEYRETTSASEIKTTFSEHSEFVTAESKTINTDEKSPSKNPHPISIKKGQNSLTKPADHTLIAVPSKVKETKTAVISENQEERNQPNLTAPTLPKPDHSVVNKLSIPPLELLSNTSEIQRVNDSKLVPNKRTSRWLFSLEAGPLQSTLGIDTKNSILASLREQTETPKLGWSVGLNAIQVQPRGLAWGIGFNYQRSWIKFNYQQEQTQEIVLDNTLLEVLLNQTTMDTIGVRFGQATVDRTDNREVQHYNETNTLSIPIHFGYLRKMQRITYGLMGSLQYNYLLQNSGRFLDAQQTIVDLQTVDDFKKSTLSAHLRPLVIFDLTRGFGLSIAPSLGFTLTNAVNGDLGYAQRPLEFGFVVGVVKEVR